MDAEPAYPEPVLCSGRGHSSERPAYHKKIKVLSGEPRKVIGKTEEEIEVKKNIISRKSYGGYI